MIPFRVFKSELNETGTNTVNRLSFRFVSFINHQHKNLSVLLLTNQIIVKASCCFRIRNGENGSRPAFMG